MQADAVCVSSQVEAEKTAGITGAEEAWSHTSPDAPLPCSIKTNLAFSFSFFFFQRMAPSYCCISFECFPKVLSVLHCEVLLACNRFKFPSERRWGKYRAFFKRNRPLSLMSAPPLRIVFCRSCCGCPGRRCKRGIMQPS